MGDLLDEKSQDISFDIPKVADLWVSHVQHAIENLEIFGNLLDIFGNLGNPFEILWNMDSPSTGTTFLKPIPSTLGHLENC
jgi:hypothetical protein